MNCLVTRGELKQGSRSGPLVAGESVGCVRVLRNDRGVRVHSVGPGYTAFIAGWKTMPPVGSIILEVTSDVGTTFLFHFETKFLVVTVLLMFYKILGNLHNYWTIFIPNIQLFDFS